MNFDMIVTEARSSQGQRVKALEFALRYHIEIENDDFEDKPRDVVDTARLFYAFLTGH